MSATRALRRLKRRLVGTPARPHRHAHDHFTEEELLRRTDEFNHNAEAHWSKIRDDAAGRSHALNKPISTVQDTGPILYRLGLLITELRLGVGHTVLDFAAGSCWLSSYLNRLRCRTIAIDVSPTALALGQELFAADPRQRPDLDPRFLPYDGHTIPLADESVDRIAVFDAFHHVPNQDEVLREMARVLRVGGRVVMAEPGEEHSHADQSHAEMETFGVLENDIHLDDLAKKARAAGFTKVLVKPYADPLAVTFDEGQFLAFMSGKDSVYPIDALRESLRHFLVVVLEKGDDRPDSRCPSVLKADIHVGPEAEALLLGGRSGGRRTIPVEVRNTGDTRWLHALDPVGGYVMLGAHLLSDTGAILTRSLTRAALPRDVAPGETVSVDLEVPFPEAMGRYQLRFDLVSEWVTWFELVGSKTPQVPLVVDRHADSAAPHRLAATISRLDETSLAAKPGTPLNVRLRLTNTGDTIWLAHTEDGTGSVRIGASRRGADGDVDRDYFRAGLPADVAPGESADVDLRMSAPPQPGRQILRVDLVDEGVCWFEHHGSQPLDLVVDVSDEMPDSTAPGLLRAEIRTAPTTLRCAPDAAISVEVDVRNAGNTLWLHAPKAQGGHVAVGAHLLDAAGRQIELDFLRAPLPRDVPPGDSVRVAAALQAPPTPGRYVIELDMVDEGIAWFGSRGSATRRVVLDVV